MHYSGEELTHHTHEVLIIGAGGAGLRAAIEAATRGKKTAVVTKVPPTRSHTVAAQGGINAALGNVAEDDWRWHMYDTIRGSDWLGDQDSIAFMCKNAPAAIMELDQMGVAFSRDEQGKIYQRAYGGMSTHYGKGGMAFRACAAADQTGDAIMRGLYQHIQQYPVDFFIEYIALDLIMTEDGTCRGVLAWELATGRLHLFEAESIILATGGFGQAYAAATSSSTCTGDGNAMILRAGLPLQDMEYVQFHPTGLHQVGILISEAARSEGGKLFNSKGEHFMTRYAPKYQELASRDIVTRAIIAEIAAGNGCGPNKDHVHLDISHLPEDIINERLPITRSIASQFADIDCTKQPIPVYPTAHYTMGGIPTTRECEVENKDGTIVPGLYAIGEAACNSVHGANRLGCNSLLDLIVFGKYAGEKASETASKQTQSHPPLTQKDIEPTLTRFDALRYGGSSDKPPLTLRHDIGLTMQDAAGILRNEQDLTAAIDALTPIHQHFTEHYELTERDLRWNNGLVQAVETLNLLEQSITVLTSARFRTESRGAHYRTDFPHRDDDNWLYHTSVLLEENGQATPTLNPVRMDTGAKDATPIPPEQRAY